VQTFKEFLLHITRLALPLFGQFGTGAMPPSRLNYSFVSYADSP
jgi:hypothetical protein